MLEWALKLETAAQRRKVPMSEEWTLEQLEQEYRDSLQNPMLRGVKITGERKNNFTVYGPDNAHAQFGLTAEQTRDEIFKLLEQNGIAITDQHKDGMNIKIKID